MFYEDYNGNESKLVNFSCKLCESSNCRVAFIRICVTGKTGNFTRIFFISLKSY